MEKQGALAKSSCGMWLKPKIMAFPAHRLKPTAMKEKL
jgi:hypothetical protein